MKTVLCIGEALIDFVPSRKGCALKEVPSFTRAAGGAPTNVCCAVARLGGSSALISQVGHDAFGEHLADVMGQCGVDLSYLSRTDTANTALAFVSLQEDGSRDFSFYRKPSADMLLSPDAIRPEWFQHAASLHFCSVDLVDCPMKEAHRRAIDEARKAGCLISFDPNVRLPLWDTAEHCREVILEFLPQAHLLKISDEEIGFLTGCETVEQAKEQLFVGNVQAVVLTKGKDGAEIHTRSGIVSVPGHPVKPLDTTGAGDSFIGALLYCLARDGVTPETLPTLPKETLSRCLEFAVYYSEYGIQGYGAITSYADREQFAAYLSQNGGQHLL